MRFIYNFYDWVDIINSMIINIVAPNENECHSLIIFAQLLYENRV